MGWGQTGQPALEPPPASQDTRGEDCASVAAWDCSKSEAQPVG